MSNRLLNVIRDISVSSAEAMKMADIFFGVVESTSPLIISIDQKLKLWGDALVLTGAVSRHRVNVSASSKLRESYVSGLKGLDGDCGIRMDFTNESIIVETNLSQGEEVILLRALGGQKYIVLDRVVG